MNIKTSTRSSKGKLSSAFTFMEVMVAMGVIGVVFVSLYSGMTMGFNMIRTARENERATQILLEKFEGIRLYTWEQINTKGFVPTKFTAPFDPQSTDGSVVFTGTVTIDDFPASLAYEDDLRMVTVQLTWPSGRLTNTRSQSSFVARYGLQNYIY